ncbi:YheT family hydrolase [Chryseolinea serpens]|uniref:YheT family hydrolase n=1 Tax=Chryseolinea serpens TaxID=947013 RepID=UPI000A029854|nr:alpha/beta fold hydrolase [Chryseolinea serpens]
MDYQRPFFLFTPHLETIYPATLRQVHGVAYTRERITTPDDDFLDLDWLQHGSSSLVIISHGLEGNSTRAYVKGMARAAYGQGIDVLAWNFRGCSEEMNRQLRFYHSGASDDLEIIVQHALAKGYKQLYLVGFSLGGNLTLKYLGERPTYPQIKRAVAFSVPLHLHSSCLKISEPSNWIYNQRFLNNLKEKVIRKATQMPGLDVTGIGNIKTLMAFDDRYTAPLHGFASALDYYTRCSALNFLHTIQIPTLIVNAQNDPFLSTACYPAAALKDHPVVKFESPQFGGHVGFAQFRKNGLYWSEERALSFLFPE